MDAQLKDAAVAEAVSKAKAEAEARVAVEMAAAVAKVEAAAAENAALNAAKQSVDRRRPDFDGRRGSSTALGLRRASASTVCPAEIGAHFPDGALAAAEASRKASSIDEPSLLKARSEYSVTQVRRGRRGGRRAGYACAERGGTVGRPGRRTGGCVCLGRGSRRGERAARPRVWGGDGGGG
eukprot:scaffold14350_cov98-Isochrysis_galbana.AAC.5